MPKPSAVNYFAKNIFQNFLKKIIKSLNGKYLTCIAHKCSDTLVLQIKRKLSAIPLCISFHIPYITYIYYTAHEVQQSLLLQSSKTPFKAKDQYSFASLVQYCITRSCVVSSIAKMAVQNSFLLPLVFVLFPGCPRKLNLSVSISKQCSDCWRFWLAV